MQAAHTAGTRLRPIGSALSPNGATTGLRDSGAGGLDRLRSVRHTSRVWPLRLGGRGCSRRIDIVTSPRLRNIRKLHLNEKKHKALRPTRQFHFAHTEALPTTTQHCRTQRSSHPHAYECNSQPTLRADIQHNRWCGLFWVDERRQKRSIYLESV